jgi:signal transduction histidine kinase
MTTTSAHGQVSRGRVRVVIIEQHPDDAERIVRELTNAGFEPEWTRVETGAALLAALDRGADIILGDALLRATGERLRRAETLEALQSIARSIEHEFKNLFAGVLGYIELLLEDLNPADPRRQDVEAIRRSIQRAVGLIRGLEPFTATGPAHSGPPAPITDISRHEHLKAARTGRGR